jgi:transcriptional repressor NrdR
LECKHRFTTYERIEFVPLTVCKKDGSKESFDRSKLLRGMARACEKTDISAQQLDNIVEEIEIQLYQLPRQEVSSAKIGELVLSYLRQVSEVAYIRFASVYGEFQGINDFIETLKQLQTPEAENPPSPDWTESVIGASPVKEGSCLNAVV